MFDVADVAIDAEFAQVVVVVVTFTAAAAPPADPAVPAFVDTDFFVADVVFLFAVAPDFALFFLLLCHSNRLKVRKNKNCIPNPMLLPTTTNQRS